MAGRRHPDEPWATLSHAHGPLETAPSPPRRARLPANGGLGGDARAVAGHVAVLDRARGSAGSAHRRHRSAPHGARGRPAPRVRSRHRTVRRRPRRHRRGDRPAARARSRDALPAGGFRDRAVRADRPGRPPRARHVGGELPAGAGARGRPRHHRRAGRRGRGRDRPDLHRPRHLAPDPEGPRIPRHLRGCTRPAPRGVRRARPDRRDRRPPQRLRPRGVAAGPRGLQRHRPAAQPAVAEDHAAARRGSSRWCARAHGPRARHRCG